MAVTYRCDAEGCDRRCTVQTFVTPKGWGPGQRISKGRFQVLCPKCLEGRYTPATTKLHEQQRIAERRAEMARRKRKNTPTGQGGLNL